MEGKVEDDDDEDEEEEDEEDSELDESDEEYEGYGDIYFLNSVFIPLPELTFLDLYASVSSKTSYASEIILPLIFSLLVSSTHNKQNTSSQIYLV